MNTILFTSSTAGYNDKIVSGLIHFTLSELLKGTTPVYAAYHPDEQELELTFPDDKKGMIEPRDPARQKNHYSARYDCVRQLMYELDPGDRLYTHSLSDFGDTAVEAEKNYFTFLSHGIVLYFFDMYFLNSDALKLSAEVSADQKQMIHNIICSYYDQNGKSPTLSSEERKEVSEMPGSKKNKIIDKARTLAAFHAGAIRYEQELKHGFIRESITSARTYERRYKKGNYSEFKNHQTDAVT